GGALGEDLQAFLGVAEASEVLLLQGHDLLLQRSDELEPSAIANVRKPRILMPTKVALADASIGRPVEQRAVRLELPNPLGRLFGVKLGHPPVIEELAAAHRVAE